MAHRHYENSPTAYCKSEYVITSQKKHSSFGVDTGTAQKATIHQVTTMLATSKNVLFLGHNHLLITSADDPSL